MYIYIHTYIYMYLHESPVTLSQLYIVGTRSGIPVVSSSTQGFQLLEFRVSTHWFKETHPTTRNLEPRTRAKVRSDMSDVPEGFVLPSGDVQKGHKLFKKHCAQCHSVFPDA